jgi:hypothetical protein
LQVKPHAALPHVAVPFVGGVHAVVQDPQWAGSVSSLTQNPLQSVYVLLHAKVQAPLVQVGPALTTAVVQV